MRRQLESKGSRAALLGRIVAQVATISFRAKTARTIRIRGGLWLGFSLVALLFGFHLTSAQAQEFLFKIPQQPSFASPGGVAIDPDGFIWVADGQHDQVVKFDPDKPGVEIRIGSLGVGDGQFNVPRGVAIDAEGSVYVADAVNARIQKFTSEGGFIRRWGSRGGGDGQFLGPRGVAVDAEGSVYVADAGSHRIQVFVTSP